ncbi:MAG TPA: translation elongation factor Ts [Gemmatimonadaceae bacterium]|nr:translation elongation factor Ts [Gemmatimonadaceae bacterium]
MSSTTKITAKEVQELRQRSGAGMMESKRALEAAGGDMEKAAAALRAKGITKAEKREGKQTSEGIIGHYVHHNHKVGVLVEVNCETDFVARTDDFKALVKELALQIASANPIAVDVSGIPAEVAERERRRFEQEVQASGKPEHLVPKIVEGKVTAFNKDHVLLLQPWIREPKKSVGELVKETSAKVGENIIVRRFARFEIGKE